MPRDLLPTGYHPVYYHERRRLLETVLPCGGRTICTIRDADGNPIAAGEARCRSNEHYVKRIGRGIAYSRALQDLHAAEQHRTHHGGTTAP